MCTSHTQSIADYLSHSLGLWRLETTNEYRSGKLGDVYIPRDMRTGDPRGFAFVRYLDQRDADDAMDRLDGEKLNGRELRIQVQSFFFFSEIGCSLYARPRCQGRTCFAISRQLSGNPGKRRFDQGTRCTPTAFCAPLLAFPFSSSRPV